MNGAPRLLYFDCFAGIAGDMTLGALVDLGLDPAELEAAIHDGVPEVGRFSLRAEPVSRGGVRGIDLQVVPREAASPRSWRAIADAIEGGNLPAPVVQRALSAFEAIGRAEARIHGVPLEAVHLHEVGALDSVVDVVGAAWGLWRLGVERVESAPPPLGRGFVQCAHGRLPLPAPATLEILRGCRVVPTELERELVTPTGAAFIATWAERIGGFPEMIVEGIGWGAGDATLPDRPNLLRLVIGRAEQPAPRCTLLETNLDDLSPEITGYLLERLFEAGARDAWLVPVQMKKNRPGVLVAALADEGARAQVEEVLLTESSTLGLRRLPITRVVLDRATETVETPFGAVQMKIGRRGDELLDVAPEYEACRRLARQAGVPLKRIYQHAIAAFLERGDRDREDPD